MARLMSKILKPKQNGLKAERLKKAESMLKKMSNHPIHSTSYTKSDVSHIDNFHEWLAFSMNVKDPDRIRNTLYFGFQPLYDLVVENRINEKARAPAVQALNGIISLGIDYLVGYYTGEPKPAEFRNGVREISSSLALLDGAPYKLKFRNVDYNGIYPNHIQMFMSKFIEYCLNGKTPLPDTVIGCACGASEIVMPFSGAIDANLGFMRRSWRRDDDRPKIVKEHKDAIAGYVQDKDVVCVEDYVCSARSLAKVMQTTAGFKPESLIGASVNGPEKLEENLKYVINQKKFKIYNLRR